MARIIYAVSGEGRGHSSRSKEILDHLKKERHTLRVFTYGKAYDYLKNYFKTTKIFGFHFSYEDNKIRYSKTFIDNLKRSKEGRDSLLKTFKEVSSFKPDIIFTDFEPMLGFIANSKKIPLVSIDNQHRITNTSINYPKKYKKEAILAKSIIRFMVSNTKYCLATSFFDSKVTNKKTILFPPILRKEVLRKKPKKRNHILVYQTTETSKRLLALLKKINERFLVYGYNIDKKEQNLTFKKSSTSNFLKDLANCKAVITNGGFTLITEALFLKKPILSVPVKNQFEQTLNSYYLQKLGYGRYYENLDKIKIESFLSNLKKYENNLKKYKTFDNSKIFKKIDEIIQELT